MRYLVDTNVIGRSGLQDDPLFSVVTSALAKLFNNNDELCIASQNLIEFRNVATRTKERNGFGLTQAEANAELLRIESVFDFLPEIPGIYEEWKHLIFDVSVEGKQVHDARLVAVMKAYGISHILTFNGDDFKRYTGIHSIDPTTI